MAVNLLSRHPIELGLVALGLAGGTGVLLWSAPAPLTAAAPAPAAAVAVQVNTLDEVSGAAIAELRRDLGLSDDALGLANLSDLQLDSVLGGLRSWYETNRAQLETRRSALADQRALVRHYQSQISQGKDESANLTAARQALAGLESDFALFLTTASGSIVTGLSEGQNTALATVKANHDLSMPYAALSLSTEQKGALTQARIQYQARLSGTTDTEKQAAFASDFGGAVGSAIGAGNLNTLNGLGEYLGAASVRVEAAIRRNLPVGE